jgi:uncharacterized protein YjbJ (UPF0337 family)
MNNDKIKGSIDDAAGRVKRQVGEWTGNTETQAEGAVQQIKGKAEKVVGNLRDAVNDAGKHRDVDIDRDRDIDDNTGRETVRERETIRDKE